MATPTVAEGGCLCGAIRYRVSDAPLFSVICHCATCRKASGAPSVAWVTFNRSEVQILTAEPQRYRSSPAVLRRFCGKCGTAISYEHAATAPTIDLTTISLDDPNVFPPTGEVWLEHRVPWVAVNPTLHQHPRGGG